MSSSDKETIPESDWTPSQRAAMKDWRTRQSRDRGEQRIANWIERQNKCHDWVCFADMADWCARKPNDLEEDERRRAKAYAELQDSVLRGEFFAQGRCRIRYLPLRVGMGVLNAEPTHKLIMGSKLPTFIGRDSWPILSSRPPAPKLWLDVEQFRFGLTRSDSVLRTVLMFCWVPRDLCLGWFNARKIDVPPWLTHPTGQARDANPVKSELLPKIKVERAAVNMLTELLKKDAHLKFAEAFQSCGESYKLSERGFRYRIWPKAREAAGLPAVAPPGRKRKTSR
jgi:hypothetical protein